MMTLDQKLTQAAEDAHHLVGDLDVPPFGKPQANRAVLALAAAVVVLLIGGLGWWMGTGNNDTTPVITQPTVTTSTTPTTTVPLPPQALTLEKVRRQAAFVSAVAEVSGGCSEDLSGGPFLCEQTIDSPLLAEPLEVEFTVAARSDITSQGDPIVEPEEFEWESQLGTAARQALEPELAGLYTWALTTHPEATERECWAGFRGDESVLAWEPGYAANEQCGVHLGGLIDEYKPTPPATTLTSEVEAPDPTAGLWSRIRPSTPEGNPEGWVFFDVADTPVGLLATGLDGLWISQDGVEWRPYAHDSVDFGDAGGFSKIAVSDLGIVVSDAGSRVWFSPDGEEWTVTELRQGTVSVSGSGLAAGDKRFLVINDERLVMSSTDGTNWHVVEGLPASDFHLVEATPFGFYASARSGGVWTSPDGVEWSQLSDDVFDGEVPNDIAGSQSNLSAVTGDGRIWHSPDGVTWTQVHTLPPAPFDNYVCTRVGASDVGFLVVALLEDPAPGDQDSGVPTAWFSDDGRVWARVATGPLGAPMCQNEVIPFDGGFLSVADMQGIERDPNDMMNDMVWIYER